MRGIAFIDDDMYYERPDGTYAQMPYRDGNAVAEILIERLTDQELVGFLTRIKKLDNSQTGS